MALKIEIEKFVRKLFYVDAVKVTVDNMAEVAQWCTGEVRTEEHMNTAKGRLVIDKYVKVRVHRPLNDRQTKAYVGDRILYAGNGYKVYTGKAFESNFEPIDKPEDGLGDVVFVSDAQKLVELSEGQSADVVQTPAHMLLEEIFVTAEKV